MAIDVKQAEFYGIKATGKRKEDMKRLYYFLRLTRETDDRMRKLWRSGQMFGTFFSQIGQEATTVVPCFFLKEGDFVGVSHRDLGAFVTRGMPIEQIINQCLTRKTSQDKGIMHPVFWGWTPAKILTPCTVVASQVPVATGTALSFKMRGTDNVALMFTGEGGTSKGEWHESLNFAGVHQLPIVYIVENNWWAESVPLNLQAGVEDLSLRAKGYGFAGYRLDGNDPPALYDFFKDLIEKIRAGEHGPALVQLDTYRWYGHSEIDPANYRAKEEEEIWKQRDPLKRMEEYLVKNKIMSQKEIEELTEQIRKDVLKAAEWALSQPDADPEEFLKQSVYAD